jgi:hypothetical protein
MATRTTLALDDDILAAAKSLAEFQHKTIGEVISSLSRKGLTPSQPAAAFRNGVPQFPIQPGARISTPELIKELMDETP